MDAAGRVSDVCLGGLVLQGGLSMLGSLALMGWLAMTPHSPHTERKRLAILAGFAFFTGLGLGPLMDYIISVNPSIILTAFLGTSVIFSCFTLSALCAQRRSYLGGERRSGPGVCVCVCVCVCVWFSCWSRCSTCSGPRPCSSRCVT
ncbi:probable Bax inhibitor 1 [Carassius gibelio]|uniref:probable Bax inhibitor 1 n=1 Tax=Carassius gibelio TaxID=101364 RepID=UPI002278AC6B|nr:probable Bax inhibitor 1 [Carassius gibelio]XP_052466481.1 probable Bax inhibitor 1 [Carassius gibelio]